MNYSRRLPFELQSIILSTSRPFLLRPSISFNPSYTFTRNSRVISAKSISIPTLPNSITTTTTTTTKPIPNLFEIYSEAYSDIPLSSLDYPQAPRSPESSLNHLLKTKKFEEATILLREIKSQQTITPRFIFLTHSYWLLRTKDSKEWLEWWDVSPSIISLNSKKLKLTPNRVEPLEISVSKILIAVCSKSNKDFGIARTIGVRAAGRGFYRIVAENLLIHLTAYAPSDISEDVWKACLNGYKQRGYIETGAKKEATKRYKVKSPSGYTRWRGIKDLKVLVEKRAQMIRMHASMGRLDLAVNLLESTVETSNLENVKIPINKLTYVDLLHKTSRSNRPDLFNTVYGLLVNMIQTTTQGRTTTRRIRIRGKLLKLTPKKSSFDPSTALEAFNYYRNPTSIHSLIREAEGGTQQPFAGIKDSAREYNLAIRQAIIAGDLQRATTWLSESISANLTPSLDTAANYIILARENDNRSFYQSIVKLLQSNSANSKPRMRAYWATALMLVHLRSKEYNLALELFSNVFNFTGIPIDIKLAVGGNNKTWSGKSKGKGVGTAKYHATIGIMPDSHTFAIAIQALVEKFLEKDEYSNSIDSLYNSLIRNSINIRPRTPAYQTQDNEEDSSALSPLDPYTFMPFLQAYAKQLRPPITLLRVLNDMHNLGLTPTKFHWGVVLRAFASSGEVNDLVYILRHLELQSILNSQQTSQSTSSITSTNLNPVTSMLSSIPVSEEIYSLLSKIKIKGGKENLDPAVYTAIIVGLGKQGELIQAGKIRDSYLSNTSDDGGKNKVDERMRDALNLLRKRENDGKVVGSLN